MPNTREAWQNFTSCDGKKLDRVIREIQNGAMPLLKEVGDRLVCNGLRKEAEKQGKRREKARAAADKRWHGDDANAYPKHDPSICLAMPSVSVSVSDSVSVNTVGLSSTVLRSPKHIHQARAKDTERGTVQVAHDPKKREPTKLADIAVHAGSAHEANIANKAAAILKLTGDGEFKRDFWVAVCRISLETGEGARALQEAMRGAKLPQTRKPRGYLIDAMRRYFREHNLPWPSDGAKKRSGA